MAEPSARRKTVKGAARSTQPDGEPVWTATATATVPPAARPLRTGPDAPPLYQQLVADLRARIFSGELAPSASLPPELTMRELYGVSAATMRQALQVLVNDGLIVKKSGHPTKVVGTTYDPVPRVQLDLPAPTKRTRFRNWDADWDGQQLVLVNSATARYAAPLDIADLDDVFVLTRHLEHPDGVRAEYRLVIPPRTIHDEPSGRWMTEFPNATDLFRSLAAAGQQLDWLTTITAVQPSLAEARDLDIGDGQPMLLHVRITLADGRPALMEETRLPADRVSIITR